MTPWHVAFGRFCLLVLGEMVTQGARFLPFWLLGALVGGLLITRVGPTLPSPPRALGGVGVGALLGVVNPLGVHGAWGLLGPLARAGWGREARTAFVVATALLGPTHLVYTLALGPALLLARLGLVLGVATLAGLLFPIPDAGPPLPADHASSPSLLGATWRTLRWSAPYVALGLGLSAWLAVLLPLLGRQPGATALVGALGGWVGPLLALTGIPLYLCGGAAIPLVGEALRQGAPPGAAVAFLVIGAATSPMHLAAWERLMGRPILLRILALVLTAALAVALL